MESIAQRRQMAYLNRANAQAAQRELSEVLLPALTGLQLLGGEASVTRDPRAIVLHSRAQYSAASLQQLGVPPETIQAAAAAAGSVVESLKSAAIQVVVQTIGVETTVQSLLAMQPPEIVVTAAIEGIAKALAKQQIMAVLQLAEKTGDAEAAINMVFGGPSQSEK